jgi:isoleucyl-tRNA synthetase
MYHIIEAMARWLAPILSFTAEEIWRHIPGTRNESVLLETWYNGLFSLEFLGKENERELWDTIIALRGEVAKELEKLRVAGQIGSSLDAEADLFCNDALYEKLSLPGDELRFLLITSYARIHHLDEHPPEAVQGTMNSPYQAWIEVVPSPHKKCIRCWHHRADVGRNDKHPQICARCIENVAGNGESREYA